MGVEWMVTVLPRSVAALGSVVAMTVSWLFPLPDYVKHEETGVGGLALGILPPGPQCA